MHKHVFYLLPNVGVEGGKNVVLFFRGDVIIGLVLVLQEFPYF